MTSYLVNSVPSDGYLVVVKRDCPTCILIEPVLGELSEEITVVTQDDPSFPAAPPAVLDEGLVISDHFEIETVPTLLKLQGGKATKRAVGWNKAQWRALSEHQSLGEDLPEARPGCGSKNLEPAHLERRETQAALEILTSRRIETGGLEDEVEACFARGWSDGLPVTPPTPARVARMLKGTQRDPGDVLGELAPDYATCTVEKVAINAVMAGCRPEYLPVVLTAVEAALEPDFNWHGLACTTYPASPIVIVNGPITEAIDMNSGFNALGQGNRANATIGRALQLVLRNVGGAVPGEIDRATLGNPGKLTFCFAEREHDSPFAPLHVERGCKAGDSAVTLFAGEGPRTVVDQLSRNPESLTQSLALTMQSVAHPKLAIGFDGALVISPEHARVFAQAGWDKVRLRAELTQRLTRPGKEMIRGAQDCDEGLPEHLEAASIPKFREGSPLIVHAGSKAGLFSAIIGGWVGGEMGSQPVTRVIRS